MKITKAIVTKTVIGLMATGLVVTTPIAVSKMHNFTADNQKAEAEISTTINAAKDTSTTAKDTTVADISTTVKQTVKQNAATTTTISAATNATATTAIAERTFMFNQIINDNSNHSLTFIDGQIANNQIKIKIQAHNSNDVNDNSKNIYFIQTKNLTFTANGQSMIRTGAIPSDLLAQAGKDGAYTWIPLAYDPSITSITASYTFDDGTTASAVLPLS